MISFKEWTMHFEAAKKTLSPEEFKKRVKYAEQFNTLLIRYMKLVKAGKYKEAGALWDSKEMKRNGQLLRGEISESTGAKFSHKQLKAFEAYIDKLFDKYDIDFRFTRHFADRINDTRNDPMIDPKELASLIMKIYRNKGTRLKSGKDFEAVLKDIETDINMPVAVKYDPKNDEFDVGLKTIMRKKNFRTPDRIIKY